MQDALLTAIREGDAKRIADLFGNCATQGSYDCKMLMAAGLKILSMDKRIPQIDQLKGCYFLPLYDQSLASDKWRKAVAAQFARFYAEGQYGFPYSIALAKCWDAVSFAQSGSIEEKRRLDICIAMEKDVLRHKTQAVFSTLGSFTRHVASASNCI